MFIDRKTRYFKMSVFMILIKIPENYFVDINKLTLTFTGRGKRPKSELNIEGKEQN